MLKLLKATIAPVLSLIILFMGNSFFLTYTSIRLKIEGSSTEIIGYATAFYFAGLLFGSFKCNKIIEKVGHIKSYASFAAMIAVLAAFQAIFLNPLFWLVIRFLVGFFIAGLFINIESWLLNQSSQNNKGKILSIYMISYYASQSIGQLLLNLSNPKTITPFAIIIILSAFSMVPICMSKIKDPIIEKNSPFNIFQLFKTAPIGGFGSLIAGFISGPIYGLIPIYVKEIGFSISQTSTVMSFTILGGILLQLPIGQLSDKIDKKKILLIVSFLTAIFAFLISIKSTYSFLSISLLLTSFGALSFSIYPVSTTHTSDISDQKNIVSAIASLCLSYSIGAIFGPVIASYSMKIFGAKGLFIYLSSMSISLFIYSYFYLLKKPYKQLAPLEIKDSENKEKEK